MKEVLGTTTTQASGNQPTGDQRSAIAERLRSCVTASGGIDCRDPNLLRGAADLIDGMLKALSTYDAYERYDTPPPFGHECSWCVECVQKMNDQRRVAIFMATRATLGSPVVTVPSNEEVVVP